MEKFDVGLEDINAHTLKIMDIIEQEKAQVKQKKMQELERGLNQ